MKPPKDACHARLAPVTGLRWGDEGIGVYRDYRVETRWCGAGAMRVPSRTVVLSSKRTGKGSDWMRGMAKDDLIRIKWNVGMRNVLDMVGGNPHLLKDGKVLPTACDGYICYRHPRTAIGTTKGGATLLVVVDGRKDASVGMTPRQLAHYLKLLGATDAVNLDGGGGATMWIDGQGIVNDPSDGNERNVTNAVLILPGADASEPKMRGFAPAALTQGA